MMIDKHTLALVSIAGCSIDVLGALYLAYDLLGGSRRGAVKLRKYTSRQPVETPIGNTFSRSPAFSTLSAIQNT